MTFMKFKTATAEVAVNMDAVTEIRSDGVNKSVLYFNFMNGAEQAYIIVEESFDAIGSRSEFIVY